jgi:hypothetical protein
MTVHHWPEPAAGLEEMRRVASRRVVLTFDPEVHNRTWLVQYVPELARLPSARRPSVQEVADGIRATSVVTVTVPHDCRDGMMVAFWRRPEAYLDRRIHAGASALQQVEPDALRRGLARLERDLASGEWERRYGHLLQYEEWDCGLRLVWGDGG